MKKNNQKIDFVVLWVNPNDPEWRQQFKKYSKNAKEGEDVDKREERYRDFDLFRYWFRGVEKYAPWVNNVFLVTCGHVPEWLNTEHPKLRVVKHADFIPKENLPTFNTNAIELSLHNIPDLSNEFVLFNDDVFVLDKVKPTDFFHKGIPVNSMSLFAVMPTPGNCGFHKTVMNDLTIINKYFGFRESIKKNLFKYLSFKQREWLLFTLPLLAYNQFMGFRNFHICNSYLKDTAKEIWNKEPDILEKTVASRFRDNENNVNDWLYNYWQFASGNYKQRNSHFGKSVVIGKEKNITKLVEKQKYKVLCINDSGCVADIEEISSRLNNSFEKLFPEKSKYEK